MPTSGTAPRVSVGVPVRNGESFLDRSLRALESSSYPNLEVIVCDNASTDATRSIAERFAARDSRFRYHRQAANLGAALNFNTAFELSTGKYTRWQAHDDW